MDVTKAAERPILKLLRLAAGCGLREFAERCGLLPRYHQIEQGRQGRIGDKGEILYDPVEPPTDAEVLAILNALRGVPADDADVIDEPWLRSVGFLVGMELDIGDGFTLESIGSNLWLTCDEGSATTGQKQPDTRRCA